MWQCGPWAPSHWLEDIRAVGLSIWTPRLLDIRVGEHLCAHGLPLDSRLPEHFGTDVHQSLYHNMKDGYVSLVGNSRIYLHDKDRTLTAEEYCYNQGWGDDIVIDQIHRPVPQLKALRAEALATSKAKKAAETGNAPAVVLDETDPAPKKKRRASSKPAAAASARGRSSGPNASSSKAGGTGGRGQHPWMSKTIDIMGNAVNLPDAGIVLLPPLLAASKESGLWERPVPDNVEFLAPENTIAFKPNLARLEEEVKAWVGFWDRFKDLEVADAIEADAPAESDAD